MSEERASAEFSNRGRGRLSRPRWHSLPRFFRHVTEINSPPHNGIDVVFWLTFGP